MPIIIIIITIIIIIIIIIEVVEPNFFLLIIIIFNDWVVFLTLCVWCCHVCERWLWQSSDSPGFSERAFNLVRMALSYGIIVTCSRIYIYIFSPPTPCSDARVLVPPSMLTCSPCRVWPASAWLCAPAAAGRSRTDTTCWPWTNSGTCAASSAASANSTWSLSSPASARTGASTARRTTTGRRAHTAWSQRRYRVLEL